MSTSTTSRGDAKIGQRAAPVTRIVSTTLSLLASLWAWCLHPPDANATEGGTHGLYVGHLPSYSATEQTYAFAASDSVDTVSLITDRLGGPKKSLVFVGVGSDREAAAATDAVNGEIVDGRHVKVNE